MSQLIQVEERSPAAVSDAIARAVPPEFWIASGCVLSRAAGDTAWTLHPGDSVGISRVKTTLGDVTLQIRPKLAGADVLFLADYAYGQRHEALKMLADNVSLEAVTQDPTACLLMWHALNVDRFASRWLRRGYATRTRVLEGKVRGKILVDQYMKNHISTGDAGRIPCKIIERTQDTPNNRILKAGLRYIATLSHTLPVPAARRAVLKQVNATLPKFSGVADVRATPAEVRATSVRGPHRHYASVLDATIALLSHRFVGDNLGRQTTQAFLWQMPVLFQEALRGIIAADSVDFSLDSSGPGRARVHDAHGTRRRTSKVDPDLVLRTATGDAYFLLDTKYKAALPRGPGSDDTIELGTKQRIKISSADIYQAVAYRQHEKWNAPRTGLLYPVCLEKNETLPKPMEIRGFGSPIDVIFVDIGRFARNNLASFRSHLRHSNVLAT
ncbi:5-methylcytosine restriction system specificity protein McrC [Williamsia muralis]|uniref:5-methylcytosine restriction system specificity protein McrC n=1 Tax=Williamsia marianensis TaxID=85044 RepID=UPI0037F1DF27